MRPCQLCGCASWGPVTHPSQAARIAEFLPAAQLEEFVRCDGCDSIAKKAFLDDADFTTPVASAPNMGAMPFGLDSLFAKVIPAVPAPPTRTERLVCEILSRNPLSASGQPPYDYAAGVVLLARLIESALDAPLAGSLDPTVKQPWLVLSFPAREEFERWCTAFWDHAVFPDISGEYAQGTYDLAVEFVKGKQHATQS